MKRYWITTDRGVEEDNDGPWVKADEAEAEIERLTARLAEAEALIREYHSVMPSQFAAAWLAAQEAT